MQFQFLSSMSFALKRVALQLMLLHFMVLSLESQHQTVQFSHLSIEDGLSQNVVNDILQDYRGFMWFATKDGLNRYDGQTFVIYQNNPFDTNSLTSNHTLSIFEDKDSILWVGTMHGLNRFDRDFERFTQYKFSDSLCLDVEINQINGITQDRGGALWLATNKGGVIRFVPGREGDSGSTYTCLNCNARENLRVTGDIYADSKFVWVAVKAGLLRIGQEDLRQTLFPVYTKHPDAVVIDSDSSVSAIFEANNGHLWLGNNSGLNYFDKLTGKYVHYPHHYAVFRYGWGIVDDIQADPSGNIWCGTADELMRFNPGSRTYTYFRHNPNNRFSISGDGVKSIYLDRGGILWVGTNGFGLNLHKTYGGSFQLLTKATNKPSRITSFSLRTIFEDSRGYIWFSSPLLNRWNRETGEIISFERSSYEVSAMGNTGVWAIIEDRQGWLWFGSTEGLFRYNPTDSTVLHFMPDDDETASLPQKDVFGLYEDSKQRIWVLTVDFIARFEPESSTFTSIAYRSSGNTYEASYAAIHEDKNGIFWINTEAGLMQFDPETWQYRMFQNDPDDRTSLNNNTVRCICPDPANPDEFLWLGTAGGGLGRFNKVTYEFYTIMEEDGLPDNVVYNILPDNSGNLWLSTNHGLCRFNPESGEVKNYDVSDGLQSNEFNSGAAFKSKSGEMFFGGIHGLNFFYPEQISENPHSPPIVLTGIKIQNVPVTVNDASTILRRSITETKEITLRHTDDILSFDYAALDYANPGKCRFKYMLEGWNNDWIEAGNTRSATFTNLPPGHYTFKVIGSNNDGIWNNTGTSLSIFVKPPVWKTPFAYLLYALIIITGLILIRRYELRRLQLKRQLALEHIEAEKLRELDQFKTDLFANISHDFRTPLTLIMGPIQQLKESLNRPDHARTLETMESNARRLLQLINEILDLSRLDAGKLELRLSWNDIVSHTRALTMSYLSLAEMREVNLRFDAGIERLITRYDTDKYEKIVLNLLSNALKFTGKEQSITVHIEHLPGGSIFDEPDIKEATVEVTIKDTGIGISSEDLENIFTRFYRARSYQNTAHQEGAGIGLALVKELVGLHGGDIRAQSRPGSGSCFTVSLPVKVRQEAVTSEEYFEPGVTGMVENEKSSFMHLPDQQLLIIEDNRDIRDFIASDFEGEFRIHEAADGQNGIELAERFIPDLIITDVMMPGMDGYEVCRQLRENEKTSHIPIILLTAKAGRSDKLEGLQTGADDYLVKPFDRAELKTRVLNLIQTRKVLREKFGKSDLLLPEPEQLNSTDQKFHNRVVGLVEDNLSNEMFSVELLGKSMSMSERQLRRKFQALYDLSPNQFLRRARIERAKLLLEKQTGSISEIAYTVGFSNVSYFAKCFKDQYGVSPSEFMNV